MSTDSSQLKQEMQAARSVLLAAAREAFPELEKRIREQPEEARQHPAFQSIVQILQNWNTGIQRRVKNGERPNHSAGDIHTRIFNTGEIILYGAESAKITSFKNGGAEALVKTTNEHHQRCNESTALDEHAKEEQRAEVELVTAMYAKLLGIEKQYAEAIRNANRTGSMDGPP